MKIAAIYSFKQGQQVVEANFAAEWAEVKEVILEIDASHYKTKVSSETTMDGRLLYSPSSLNQAFTQSFLMRGWQKHREKCAYTADYYVSDYSPSTVVHSAYREMDFVKHRLGVEVQFGKYAFMVYNVCAKMTIFRNLNVIDAGVEIVPVKDMAVEMSSGVSYFEQIVWDLEQRGVADIDIPVVIVGVAP